MCGFGTVPQRQQCGVEASASSFTSVFWNFPGHAKEWLALYSSSCFSKGNTQRQVLEHSTDSLILILPGQWAHRPHIFLWPRDYPESPGGPPPDFLQGMGRARHPHPESLWLARIGGISCVLAQPGILPVDGKQMINLKVPVPKSVQTLEDWGQ